MATDRLTDIFIEKLAVGAISLPKGCVGNIQIADNAGIDPTKTKQRLYLTVSQKNGAINVAQRQALAAAIHGTTGKVIAVYARNITTAGGSDTTSIQIKKNGTNILTSALVLNAAATTATQSTVAFTDDALVAGDQLDLDATVTGSSPGQGLSVTVVIDVDPQ